jgi:hypothetical protein
MCTKNKLLKIIILILIGISSSIYSYKESTTSSSTTSPSKGDSVLTPIAKIKTYAKNQTSKVTVTIKGTVTKILSDDNSGARHQRFIIKLSNSQTLMISHNIDIAPRVNGLKVSRQIIVHGEYVWNEQGGLVHWTHHDPDGDGSHENGWIIYENKKYQ